MGAAFQRTSTLLVLALVISASPAIAQPTPSQAYAKRIRLAIKFLFEKNYPSAERAVSEALDLDSLRADAHCLKGSLRRMQKQHSKSLGNYRECEKRATQHGELLWQARALMAIADTLQHLAIFGEGNVGELAPADLNRRREGRIADALSVYERLAKIAQRIPDLLPPALVKRRKELLLAASERRESYRLVAERSKGSTSP